MSALWLQEQQLVQSGAGDFIQVEQAPRQQRDTECEPFWRVHISKSPKFAERKTKVMQQCRDTYSKTHSRAKFIKRHTSATRQVSYLHEIILVALKQGDLYKI